jgi:hypothetical protein
VDAARREAAGVRELATAADWAKVSDMQAAARIEQNAGVRGLLNKRIAETIALLKELDELNGRIAANGAKTPEMELHASTVGPDTFRYNMPDTGQKSPALNVVGLPDQIKPAKADMRAYNDEIQRSIALNQQWGAAIGQAVGELVTGQASVGQVMARMGQMIIQTVVQGAIAQITANASVAASGAAASQASVPIVGPVLAISAMGAMLSAVLGLMSNLPSAAGGWWDTGNYEGLAMIHKREMVLSPREAEAVRRGSGGGITLNVGGVIDSGSLERTITRNDGAFARAQRKMARQRRI